MAIVIHAAGGIAWHRPFAKKMLAGLKKIGIEARISDGRFRQSEIAILLGTTLWQQLETDGQFLLVDRCSFGDTNEFVSLVWNGHGRRGEHCVPDNPHGRQLPPAHPWTTGRKVVLCGQDAPYSPDYRRMGDWYKTVQATHFRKHPAAPNLTGLPLSHDWRDVGQAITLNSSVGVEAVLRGIPTVCIDESAMAWAVSGRSQYEVITPERRDWLNWLSWTQWGHDEILAGEPIKHLFEARK